MSTPRTNEGIEARLTGRIAAKGLLSPEVQTSIPKLVKMDLPAVTRAVVHALRVSGVNGVKMPAPVGIKTPDLVGHARFVAVTICDAYHRAGGALTARGFRGVGELVECLHYDWLQQMPPPVEVSWLLDTVDEEERAKRLALAAQAICAEFLKRTQTGMLDAEHLLKGDLLEPFCVAAAKAAVKTFDDPNGFIHTRAHGELD